MSEARNEALELLRVRDMSPYSYKRRPFRTDRMLQRAVWRRQGAALQAAIAAAERYRNDMEIWMNRSEYG